MLLLLVIDGYAMVEKLEQSGHVPVSYVPDPPLRIYGRRAHWEEADDVQSQGYLDRYNTKVEIIFCLPNALFT